MKSFSLASRSYLSLTVSVFKKVSSGFIKPTPWIVIFLGVLEVNPLFSPPP